MSFDRLPAIPLIVNDPYFSIWLPEDKPTSAITCHWTGARKPMTGYLTIDGVRYRFLGKNGTKIMQTKDVRITPTGTFFVEEAGGVELTLSFVTPMLPDDLDLLSTPVTFVSFEIRSTDGKDHQVNVDLDISSALCYDGAIAPEMNVQEYAADDIHFARVGQVQQNVLCHSADMITMDWGYLYAAAKQTVTAKQNGIHYSFSADCGKEKISDTLLLGYEDIASINYFGTPCKAWFTREGDTLPAAMERLLKDKDAVLARCTRLDLEMQKEALKIAGEDYRLIVAASWRQAIGAHKLIVTPEGEMALLSKENNSNGCIGTVDVSYPSIPLFLKYCPELVNALCRPVLKFASLPVWEGDFAPHDVGRYPYATGQMYALKAYPRQGLVVPPVYALPAGTDPYDFRSQMPVEECGNMLIMLETAMYFGAESDLAADYLPTLATWAKYLDIYGEDPAEQLCTDDFAGHLAHNINLSCKALVGIACYARLLRRFHKEEEARIWEARTISLRDSILDRIGDQGNTPLSYEGSGWSMKYNLAWDQILELGLFSADFYRKETQSYIPRINPYGLPLDSRADYTKADWLIWCASMAQDKETKTALIKPVADFLRESKTRVAFSDWYDTISGDYVEFIARSVVGGVFMPML